MDRTTIDRAVAASVIAPKTQLCVPVLWVLVDPQERRAADTMLALMQDELRLPVDLRVAWFRAATGPAIAINAASVFDTVAPTTIGLYRREVDPDVLWVRAGIGPRQAAEVVAHEARHAWQWLKFGIWGDWHDDPVLSEQDAYQFQVAVVERYSRPSIEKGS